jgi:hypothetical protein
VISELDRLLDRLRRTERSHNGLDQLETLVWKRIAARERPARWADFALPLRLAAIVGAFAWGILAGSGVISADEAARSADILVEQVEFLAQESTGPLS